MRYDKIAVNTIVKNKENEVSSCDIAYTDDLERFNEDYLQYTAQVRDTCSDHRLPALVISMVAATVHLPRW